MMIAANNNMFAANSFVELLKGEECEGCLKWYHVKWVDISDDEYRNISETVWYCRKCIAIREKSSSVQQARLFLRYVDGIVRTVKSDPETKLRDANLLHPILQFTIETPNTKMKLAFSDLQISIDKSTKTNCGWYQKPTDTGTTLNFRSCAPSVQEKCDWKNCSPGFPQYVNMGRI